MIRSSLFALLGAGMLWAAAVSHPADQPTVAALPAVFSALQPSAGRVTYIAEFRDWLNDAVKPKKYIA